MESHVEIASDNDAPPSLLAALRERVVIPYFRQGDGMYAKQFANGWHRHVAPARRCDGAQTYYWALFRLEAGELEQQVRSFDEFRQDHRNASRPA